MSNHTGSYMLNEVLREMLAQQIFEEMGQARSQTLVQKILKISENYDCNPGEILEGIGQIFQICYCCSKTTKLVEDGLCEVCLRGD